MYYYIEPEVSGGIGKQSVIDASRHPPLIKKLNFEFDGWLGDDIIESFPCFIVSDSLKNKIEQEKLTGFEIDEVEVTVSNTFDDLHGDKRLPKFHWLKATGKAGQHDFGIAKDLRLVISENALRVIRKTKIEHASIEEYE